MNRWWTTCWPLALNGWSSKQMAVIRHDRALLYAKVGHHKGTARLRYDHLRSYEECLLWIPDAIAWCWGRGGMWRTRVKKLITTVRVL